MHASVALGSLQEGALLRLAEELAFVLRPGDTIALHGDLGAGKTTFARAVIRAVLGEPLAEVPSPTFTLVQSYETPRMAIAHCDLYRLADATELDELGIEDALTRGAVLIEWPERAGGRLPTERLNIMLSESGQPEHRDVSLSGSGAWPARIDRLMAMRAAIRAAGWQGDDCHLAYFQGDASPRRYARLTRVSRGDAQPLSAVVMDAPRQPDGPPIRDGLPYSRIAHIAEDVRAFVAVATALRAAGIAAPEIAAHDLANGLLVVEDLGADVFGAALRRGANQETLWRAGVDVLAHLAQVPVAAELPLPDGSTYRLPLYDRAALAIETELIVDWYWPLLKGATIPADLRAEFVALWQPVLQRLEALPRRWVLRDFHSPNLIWRENLSDLERVGVIDFQDALAGPAAYDLVSLLQDARLDVAPELEARLFNHYCARVGISEIGGETRDLLDFGYAALGAQRNTKIAGIFARLALRDGKPGYLAHLPRIWNYLERNLAHAELAPLACWYERHFPHAERLARQGPG